MKLIQKLIGQRFGRLVVESRCKDKARISWNCVCDCGNTKIITSSNLTHGKTKSCGCLKKELMSKNRTVDLSGKVFGRLTVLENKGITPQGNKRWICKCNCGNLITVVATSLVQGLTKSCGCFRAEGNTIRHSYENDKIRQAFKLHTNYKSAASNRGIEFDLTKEFFLEQLDEPCFYCKSNEKQHGYDRINSKKGYIIGNVVTCCSTCNYAKNKYLIKDFVKYLDRIYDLKERPSERIRKEYNKLKGIE